MNIGIDIDGVLTDLEKMVIDNGTKLCLEKNWPIKINAIEYDVGKTFNWSREQEDEFWLTYFIEYVQKSRPRVFASEIINKLKQEGNKIYLITARDNYGIPQKYYGKIQNLTKKWLKKNNIKYEKILFVKDEEKLQQCIENNIKVMIEDSPKNIENISKQIKVIKFASQYNKEINNENVITALSWPHIYRIIKELMEGI